MNAIKISAESLKSFQHDKNVVENQLPEPPAMIMEQEDGTMKEFHREDFCYFSESDLCAILNQKEIHDFQWGPYHDKIIGYLNDICINIEINDIRTELKVFILNKDLSDLYDIADAIQDRLDETEKNVSEEVKRKFIVTPDLHYWPHIIVNCV